MNLLQMGSIQELYELSTSGAAGHCGIVIVNVGETWVEGSMPIDGRNCSPDGSVSLGALAMLAESVGSSASTLSVDRGKFICLGQSIQVYHFASTSAGPLIGLAFPVAIQPD